MPELPEVETIARDLSGHLAGRRIEAVEVLAEKTVWPAPAVFKAGLVGRKIAKVGRRGKLIIISLSPARAGAPDYLLIHLKMTGQLIYSDRRTRIAGGHSLTKAATGDAAVGGTLPNRHTRAVLTLSGGGRLFFNDLRRFGYLKLTSGSELEKILARSYGPEPLTPEFSLAAFAAVLKGKTTKIKALLLDQTMIAGLGNIYVDESLYAARLKPQRSAGSLRPAEVKALWQAINRIIRQAVKYRGTTFSDYRDSSGRAGNFSRFLKVYGRAGENCPRCGRPIQKVKVAGRGTHYCPHCQK